MTDVQTEHSVLEQALTAFKSQKAGVISRLKRAMDRRKEYDPEVHARLTFEREQFHTAELLLKRIGKPEC